MVNRRKLVNGWKWQTRFWDNIIRNENAYQRIAWYIIRNPKNWNKDQFNQ